MNKLIVLIFIPFLAFAVSCKEDCIGSPPTPQEKLKVRYRKSIDYKDVCDSTVRVKLIGDCFDQEILFIKNNSDFFYQCYGSDNLVLISYDVRIQKELCSTDTVNFQGIYYFPNFNDTLNFFYKRNLRNGCHGEQDFFVHLHTLRGNDTIQ